MYLAAYHFEPRQQHRSLPLARCFHQRKRLDETSAQLLSLGWNLSWVMYCKSTTDFGISKGCLYFPAHPDNTLQKNEYVDSVKLTCFGPEHDGEQAYFLPYRHHPQIGQVIDQSGVARPESSQPKTTLPFIVPNPSS
ncbi:hypothetical protein PCANC_07348 [Puccinia coronata f. sp. avenae]|uniref:Uncharacterized protein n=1 Tax=Puccinia coronata f. sp. avenae TaxID=200324 RepID=A0A2N5U517_9BASI|nr:hypothetical protein PCASD_23893 [Puccinia coronata f. sp. avenae]PLW21037.1 hypothetical protein PCANC_07348 [Puccinia coronata f. sp. avenae]PLW32855.1 hypothetical protein PCASD_13967 [Puccinia coronata f. sp. avenae]